MSCIFISSSSKVVDIKEPLRKPESQFIIHSTVKKSICALDAISTCRMPDIMIPLNQTWLIVYKDWIYVIFGNTVYIIHLHYFFGNTVSVKSSLKAFPWQVYNVPPILIHFHLDQGGRVSLYGEDWISPGLHVQKYVFITCHRINCSMYLKLPQGFSKSFYFLYLIVKTLCYCVYSFSCCIN